MLLSVMDEDLVGNDLLGYCYIWLSDCSYKLNSTEKILPKWTQLYLEKSNRAQGQILISFYILDSEHRNDIYNLNIQPETIPFTVEINALGLRELKPLSFIPVKKAFISFDLNSINVSSKDDGGLEPIKTLPKLPGSNPNINSVIKFNVK
jgi:superfamily I DNA and/or RNA helicase